MELNRLPEPPTLSKLPSEILSLILRNFCLHCREPQEIPQAFYVGKDQDEDEPSWYALDLRTLSSVCLVSRRLCHIAQTILYHEFVPGYGSSWLSNEYFWDRRLNYFLRTVAVRPDLGLLVHRLYMPSYLLFNDRTEDEAEATLTEAAQTRGIDLLAFLAPFRASWSGVGYQSYYPRGDELAGMLLSCLPNLTWLALIPGPKYRGIPSSSLGAAGVSKLSLRTLDIWLRDTDLRHRLGGIYEMSLDSIRTLNLTLCCGEGIRSLDRFLPNLRNISITSGREILGSDLELLLSRCEHLETFIYEAVSTSDYIKLSDIVKHLGRHKNTLKKLHLDLVKTKVTLLPETIPSLADFSALQDLFLNSIFLFSDSTETQHDQNILIQLLPPSIVSLRLVSNANAPVITRLAGALLRLADAPSQGQFLGLKMIRCDTGERFDNYGMAEKFVRVGVDFGYDTWAFSHMRPRQ
ncbi:hypothetical protein GQ53DRAFT_755943 [Thozetella sp. PMI_491]|nr:hypothetical protein GQ53DRAFT_755943 [Thozetella sp. PMI_491]